MSAKHILHSKQYYALLAFLAGLTFVAPLVEHGGISRVVIGTLVVASLMSATRAVSCSKRLDVKRLLLAIVASSIWIMGFCINGFPFDTIYFQFVSYSLVLAFFASISLTILKDVLSGEVNANRICGSVCVFVLIGFCFALIQMMICVSDSHAYRDNIKNEYISVTNGHEAYPQFSYFSFCTLSTVGYGDIVPTSRLARSLSCLESISGQLYLTILIARLVGLHIAGGGPEKTETTEAESPTVERKRELVGSSR
jgi:hypothetical protein